MPALAHAASPGLVAVTDGASFPGLVDMRPVSEVTRAVMVPLPQSIMAVKLAALAVAGVPVSLASSTLEAASLFVAGQGAGAVSIQVAEL